MTSWSLRLPANMAQIRQSWPDSSLDFQAKVFQNFEVVPSSRVPEVSGTGASQAERERKRDGGWCRVEGGGFRV